MVNNKIVSSEAKRFKKLWHYSTRLKEGGKAWERVMCEMEMILKRAKRNEIY